MNPSRVAAAAGVVLGLSRPSSAPPDVVPADMGAPLSGDQGWEAPTLGELVGGIAGRTELSTCREYAGPESFRSSSICSGDFAAVWPAYATGGPSAGRSHASGMSS